MIGTTLVREAPSPIRPGPSRPNALPVLIEVPALPGSRTRRGRPSARRVSAGPRPRRRLRREIRLAAFIIILAALAASAAIVARGVMPGPDGSERGGPIDGPEQFGIVLEPPIPVPVGAIPQDGWIEEVPVAFPGYLLPGDGEQEHGHERP